MARTNIPVSVIARTGVSLPAFVPADMSNGHVVTGNRGRTFLHAENTNLSLAYTLTVQSTADLDGLAVADLAVIIPSNGEKMLGPFSTTTFNQEDGSLYVDVDGNTGLGIRALELP